MNNFIVWDKEYKEFYNKDTDFFKLQKGRTELYSMNEQYPYSDISMAFTIFDLIEDDDFEVLEDIGIKDINDNNIYADCSIVTARVNDENIQEYKIIFSKNRMAYVLKILNSVDIFTFLNNKIEILEVIDTVQENKLGLIKELS